MIGSLGQSGQKMVGYGREHDGTLAEIIELGSRCAERCKKEVRLKAMIAKAA
jgi:hypothetical protein